MKLLLLILIILGYSSNGVKSQVIIGDIPCSDSIFIVKSRKNFKSYHIYKDAVSMYFLDTLNIEFNSFDVISSLEIPIRVVHTPNDYVNISTKDIQTDRGLSISFAKAIFDFRKFDPNDIYNLYDNVLSDSLAKDGCGFLGYPAMPWGVPNLVLDDVMYLNDKKISSKDLVSRLQYSTIINPDLSFASWTRPRAFINKKGVIALYIFGAPDTRLYFNGQGFAPYLIRVTLNEKKQNKISIHLLPGKLINDYGFSYGKCFEKAFY